MVRTCARNSAASDVAPGSRAEAVDQTQAVKSQFSIKITRVDVVEGVVVDLRSGGQGGPRECNSLFPPNFIIKQASFRG